MITLTRWLSILQCLRGNSAQLSELAILILALFSFVVFFLVVFFLLILGKGPGSNSQQHVVSNVREGSVAHDLLRVNDRILSINNMPVSSLPRSEVVQLIVTVDQLDLQVKRTTKGSATEIVIYRQARGFGFKLGVNKGWFE